MIYLVPADDRLIKARTADSAAKTRILIAVSDFFIKYCGQY